MKPDGDRAFRIRIEVKVMADSSERTGGFTWFLAGAVCGAVIALLYAPNTGQQTRKLIGKKTDETKDALSDGGKEIVEKGKELFDRGRQIAEEAAELFERGRKLARG
jgi:gas vesicle protein